MILAHFAYSGWMAVSSQWRSASSGGVGEARDIRKPDAGRRRRPPEARNMLGMLVVMSLLLFIAFGVGLFCIFKPFLIFWG